MLALTNVHSHWGGGSHPMKSCFDRKILPRFVLKTAVCVRPFSAKPNVHFFLTQHGKNSITAGQPNGENGTIEGAAKNRFISYVHIVRQLSLLSQYPEYFNERDFWKRLKKWVYWPNDSGKKNLPIMLRSPLVVLSQMNELGWASRRFTKRVSEAWLYSQCFLVNTDVLMCTRLSNTHN